MLLAVYSLGLGLPFIGDRGKFPGTQLHKGNCCSCEIESYQAFARASAFRNFRPCTLAREFAPVTFIAAAAAIGPFMRASSAPKKQFGRIEKTVGALLVLTGVAFLTGGFQSMSLWLIETFPQFGQVG